MAIGDNYRLSVRSQHNSTFDDVVNGWHFTQLSALVFDTPGEDLIAAWANYCSATYLGSMSVNYTLDLFEVRQVTGGNEITQAAVSLAGTRGTSATQLPPQVSCVVNWGTGLAGRRFRGRTFMPPASEGDVVDGRFEPTYISGVENFALAMIQDMPSINVNFAQWELVVFSTAGAPTATPIVTGVPNTNPATRRSRRFGVGS